MDLIYPPYQIHQVSEWIIGSYWGHFGDVKKVYVFDFKPCLRVNRAPRSDQAITRLRVTTKITEATAKLYVFNYINLKRKHKVREVS